ncbi:MAG: DegT/DnrJ/EryC1/StrS family aminotransferase [Marinobacter sp.]
MIPMVDLAAGHAAHQEAIEKAVSGVIRSGHFIGGPEVRAFEQEVAAFLGVPHAISCASGTDALHLGLLALGIGPGDEVITTPFTFFATIEAIVYVGARPVFVDIDPATLNLDVGQLADAVTERTRAVLPVHIFGQPVAMEELMVFADRHGLTVVEDCAQSFGARRGGRYTGSFGDVGAFSFFPTKNLGACGDGGLMVTGSAEVADRLRLLCNHGSPERNRHQRIGYNSRLDAIQAAILRIKLRHVEAANEARRQVARWYKAGLQGIAGIDLPQTPDGGDHVYHQYTVLVPEQTRQALAEKLSQAGISTAVHYATPAYRQPALAPDYQGLCLPVTESVTRRCLSLPIYPELRPEQVETIVGTILRSL